MSVRFPFRPWEEDEGAAFTLVELLVAMSVLILLVLLVSQLLNSAAAVIIGGGKHLDADSQARLVLDRMTVDFGKIVKRADVDYYFQKNTGGAGSAQNDQMAFYSESTGYYPSAITSSVLQSNVSLVGYRINASNQLERLSKALIWNGVTGANAGASGLAAGASPMVFLPQTILGTWQDIAGAGADPDYQVIGDDVYRMEMCFLVQNSTTPNPVLSDTPYLAPDTNINGLADVSAIVVTIGVLDPASRALASNAALTAAGAQLPDVSGKTISVPPAVLWQQQIISGNLGLPKAAASQVRVYQRYFYLNRIQ